MYKYITVRIQAHVYVYTYRHKGPYKGKITSFWAVYGMPIQLKIRSLNPQYFRFRILPVLLLLSLKPLNGLTSANDIS